MCMVFMMLQYEILGWQAILSLSSHDWQFVQVPLCEPVLNCILMALHARAVLNSFITIVLCVFSFAFSGLSYPLFT